MSNYYKRASIRVQCVNGRGATTERLPCKPEDLGSNPGSVTFSLHSSLVTIEKKITQLFEVPDKKPNDIISK
ncbi:hypothetical protein TSAR_010322 [Trichomalopsis sarcophagae]|uniref:Uncharacterized protein n=1 Tax=Trichomalopsis sarcophagae TaxID=543379 RepID=A0A232EKV3_9HYME|nr:hypothetical protein TSAR_010322 [Trichomalopsis sarcophagae]